MDRFWYAFIPLFVALDGIGLLPLFLTLTQRLTALQRREAVRQAVFTASLVTVGFPLVSGSVFALMGLELADVMVAGGVILLVLCLRDLLFSDEPPKGEHASPGMVPLGVPLLAGPAVLTTVLLVKNQSGWTTTLIALAANMAVVWLVLRSSEWLMRRLGREGTRLVSKIFNLVLTAYGVMLIRRGLFVIFNKATTGF